MKSEQPTFRAMNLVWGGLLGAAFAFAMFFAGYALEENRPPLALNQPTLESYLQFISWPWLLTIIAVFALWGYLFNNWIGDTISDIYHWFR